MQITVPLAITFAGYVMSAENNLHSTAVIVRTFASGVHFGYLVSRSGKEVTLKDSRRLWEWFGAMTCSEIAIHGIDIEKSRVACRVNTVLPDATEIIQCSQKAVDCLEKATWK